MQLPYNPKAAFLGIYREMKTSFTQKHVDNVYYSFICMI